VDATLWSGKVKLSYVHRLLPCLLVTGAVYALAFGTRFIE
jgi:hypothetical protein